MDKYVYKPYSNIFPTLFEKEKQRILSCVQQPIVVEHVGSTSIPGLGGKGILDIAISAPQEKLENVSLSLQQLGYEFRPHFSTPERLYFIGYLPDPEQGKRRYHIHLMPTFSKEWKEMLGFRDYLKSHPEALDEYANIKKKASTSTDQDGEIYRKMKEPMFRKILNIYSDFERSG